jgi:hypothetical protein
LDTASFPISSQASSHKSVMNCFQDWLAKANFAQPQL